MDSLLRVNSSRLNRRLIREQTLKNGYGEMYDSLWAVLCLPYFRIEKRPWTKDPAVRLIAGKVCHYLHADKSRSQSSGKTAVQGHYPRLVHNRAILVSHLKRVPSGLATAISRPSRMDHRTTRWVSSVNMFPATANSVWTKREEKGEKGQDCPRSEPRACGRESEVRKADTIVTWRLPIFSGSCSE
jgi:hypothetical protein